jgi:hypothetical protein
VVTFDLFGLGEDQARKRLLAEVDAARRGTARPENPPEFPGAYTPGGVRAADLPAPIGPVSRPRRPAFPGARRLWPAILPLVAVAAVLGVLVWLNSDGNEPAASGRPGGTAASASPTASWGTPAAPGTSPPARSGHFGVSYDVKAGYSLVIRPGGYMTQQFVAATATLTWVGVIAGCDPSLTFDCGPAGASFGELDIQILDDERVIAKAAIRTTNNNGTSEAKLDPAAGDLEVGRKYTMRVVNSTGEPIGFYFNRDSDPELETVVSGAYHSEDNGPNSSDLSALIDNRVIRS